MANAVLAHENFADASAATVSVSSSLTLTPPSRLTSQFPQIVKKCRNRGEATWAVLVDLGSQVTFDIFGLIGVNLTSAATARFRLSTADSSGLVGDAYDSGVLSSLVDSDYGYLLHRASASKTGRYAYINVAEAGLDYIEAGRVVMALGSQVSYNFSPGWGRNRVDPSKRIATEDGVVYVDSRDKRRVWRLSFNFLSQSEANGFVEQMNLQNGESDDVLLITDPDSSNLGRDSLWGLITGGQELVQPHVINNYFSRSYTIHERL